MSLPGSGKSSSNGEGKLLTIMLIVAAAFLVAGVIILSVPLNQNYGKFLWDW